MPSVIFNSIISKTVGGQIDFGGDAFKVMLVSDAYRPDRKRHNSKADVADAEVNGFGYVPGGNDVVVQIDTKNASNEVDIALGGSTWDNASIRARGAAYYRAGNEELVAYIDFGRDVISTNGTFELTESTLRIQNG